MNSCIRILFTFSVLLHTIPTHIVKAGDVIQFENHKKVYLIGDQISYFEDQEGVATIADILHNDTQLQFQNHDDKVFNRPGTKSTYWFKITVQNRSPEDIWLEVGSNYAWYIDFYAPDSLGNYTSAIQTGTMRPDSVKLYDVNYFWLPLNAAHDVSAKTYYLKIRSGLTFELPLHLGTIRSLSKNKSRNDYFTAGFIGIILIMLMYNLFIFISTRDKIYVYYLGYLFFMLFSIPYANGYPFIQDMDFLFFDKDFWNSYFLVWHGPAYFFAGAFCIQYLRLKERSKWLYRIVLSEIAVLSFGFPLLNLVGFQLVELVNPVQISILLFYTTCLFTAYYFIFKGVKQAYFYALGWTFLILGAFVFFAVINGFLPYNPLARNALCIGVAIEVGLFSLALGNRLNEFRKEKDKAKSTNIQLVKNQNELLEREVTRRTAELENINQELSESNEELLLNTEQLDAQSSKLRELNHTKDRLFAIVSHDLRSPINSLKGLMDLIWGQNMSKEEFFQFSINAKKGIEHAHFMLNNLLNWANSQLHGMKTTPEYIELYPLLLQNHFQLQELSENKNIDVSLSLKRDIMVYADRDQLNLIIRNLIINAIKFTESGGKVNISASNIDSNCQITIKDTGVGISEHDMQNLFKMESGRSKPGTIGEKGTGLGLILCKDFAEKNEGKLWLESKIGEGTTIYLTLPQAKVGEITEVA